MKSFYGQDSTFSFSGETHVGKSDIFDTLSRIREMLKGNSRCEKIGRVMEKVYSCTWGRRDECSSFWIIHYGERVPCVRRWVLC